MKEELTNLFLAESANTIITRMVTVFSKYDLEKILKPVAVKVTIVDEEALIKHIQKIWPFNIKEPKIDLKNQRIDFKFYGKCYVPKKYSMFIIMEGAYSLEPTKENDTLMDIDESKAQAHAIDLSGAPGVEIEYI